MSATKDEHSLDVPSQHATHPSKTDPVVELNPSILTTYLEYLLTGELSDITIYAPLQEDTTKKVEFKLHRFIVASRSQTLAALLQHASVIEIPCPSHLFQALVWAMYTDVNENIPEVLLPQLFWAAEYYQIRPAQTWCLQRLIHCVTPTNCIDIANDIIANYSILDFTNAGLVCPEYPLHAAPAGLRYLVEVIASCVQHQTLDKAQMLRLPIQMLVMVEEFITDAAIAAASKPR